MNNNYRPEIVGLNVILVLVIFVYFVLIIRIILIIEKNKYDQKKYFSDFKLFTFFI